MMVAVAAAFGAGTVVADPSRSGEESPGSAALVEVPVAVHDLPAGHTITADDVTVRTVPAGAVLGRPAGEPIGRTTSSPVFGDEPITESRLATTGRLGLRGDEVAVGVVPPLAPLPVAPGDVVSLVALEAGPSGGATTRPLGQARVVAVDDRVVAVAVPAELAPSVLAAQAVGTVELTLTPWTS